MKLLGTVASSFAVMLSLAIWGAQPIAPVNIPFWEARQDKKADDEKVYTAEEVDVKAKIKNKLENLPERKNDCPDPVQAKVKVILHKSGKVTDVVLIEGTGCSYDQEVIKAVRKLKFAPALKDGHPVSQFADLEYKTSSVKWPSERR